MIIDKVGGIGPGYAPRKPDSAQRPDAPRQGTDNVQISVEGARAAQADRIARLAQGTEDGSRADRIKEVREKLNSGAYDNISDEMLSSTADSVANQLLTGQP